MKDGQLLIFGSAGRYIQGPGAIKYLGNLASQISKKKKVYVLLDSGISFLVNRIERSLKEEAIEYFLSKFDGNVRIQKADTISEEILSAGGIDIIIGIGGGKTIDMSKLIARRLNYRNMIVPTIAATDAPVSHLAVASDENNNIIDEENFFSPDIVLVDSEIIAAAPVRYFVSGIGDAISKKYEVLNAIAADENNFFNGKPVYFIKSLLEIHHQTLLKYSLEAKKSVEKKETNEIVEKVLTSIILLSGMLFENGGLIGAHSIANVLNMEGFGKKNMHGELVSVGILLQIILQKLPVDELERIDGLFQSLGLPYNFTKLGINIDDSQKIQSICKGISTRLKKHNFIRSEKEILEAIEILEQRSWK